MNELTTLISPENNEDTLWINQDAIFSMGDFEPGQNINYELNIPGNGVYIFVIEGSAKLGDKILNKRDGLGVYNISSFTIETEAQSRLLLMEIPMYNKARFKLRLIYLNCLQNKCDMICCNSQLISTLWRNRN